MNPRSLGARIRNPRMVPASLSRLRLDTVLEAAGPRRALVIDPSTGRITDAHRWIAPCDFVPTDDYIAGPHRHHAE